MPVITEGNLRFEFDAGWEVSKLDEWSYYRNQYQSTCGGAKSVDILALEPGLACMWCIEIKDYRRQRRTKTLHVAEEAAYKVRDSLALLAAARVRANDEDEKRMAGSALRARDIRVVLHLEQAAQSSKLFPRTIDLANVQQRLRQLVRAIDPHARACEMNRMTGCAWTVK
jgi:hypothetical protein